MGETEETCDAALALLRIDPKSVDSDQAVGHSIQLSARRLLVLKSSSSSSFDITTRQLLILSKLLHHFGPSPLRSLRLLIAEVIFESATSPVQRNRHLAASLHKWVMVLFGPEITQRRCEFLAVGLARLACQHLGIDYHPPDITNNEAEQQQSNDSAYEDMIKINKAAQVDTEARLSEQLASLSPIELLSSYCQSLVYLLSPLGDSKGILTVEVFTPSILGIFDILTDALLKCRTAASAAELARVQNLSLPIFGLTASLATSSFCRQLWPFSRKLMKPIFLAGSVIGVEKDTYLFTTWANALKSCIETFGFRSSLVEEPLVKENLDVLLNAMRTHLNNENVTEKTCSVLSNSVGVYSSLLKNSLPAQRSAAIDSLISSALQIITTSLSSSGSLPHLCVKCSGQMAGFLSAGILSPPFSSGGAPMTHPTISSILSALSENSHHLDIEVGASFAAMLAVCLTATARPMAPPIFAPTVAHNLKPKEPLVFIESTSDVVEVVDLNQKTDTARNRLLSTDSPSSPKAIKISSSTSIKAQNESNNDKINCVEIDDNDEDVIVLADDSVLVETGRKAFSPLKKRKAADNIYDEDVTVIDGLFSTFVPAPPD